jgi:hypothetical protein
MTRRKLMNDAKKRARRRALRAAKVATLGLALAGGCYAQHEVEDPVATADAASPTDAAPDLGLDAAPTDLGTDMHAADAGRCEVGESWSECCTRVEWRCDDANSWGCCAWGPYVPPAEGALPPSRERIG